MLDCVEEPVNCIVAYRTNDSAENQQLDAEVRCHHDCAWELRFVGGCNTQDSTDRFILARHGGSFPGWWKQTYDTSRGYDFNRERKSGNRIATHCKGWDVAVYVRQRSVPLEECRDVVLQSMGSQTCIFCQLHEVPLITAPYVTNTTCCLSGSRSTTCSKSITLRCPVEGCHSAVCKTHEEEIVKERTKIYVPLVGSENHSINSGTGGNGALQPDGPTVGDNDDDDEEAISVQSEPGITYEPTSDLRDNLVFDGEEEASVQSEPETRRARS